MINDDYNFDPDDYYSDDRTTCYACEQKDYSIKIDCKNCGEKFHEECYEIHSCVVENE